MKRQILGLLIIVLAGLGLTLSHSRAVWSVQRTERLQHVPAPASYSGLINPFEHPQDQFCVVLREIGPDSDAVRAIVQDAVVNRSAEWAAELMKRVPCKIVEAADEEATRAIEHRLLDAGADGIARLVLHEFATLLSAELESPIGKPSQVLDVDWLSNGQDAIAKMRESPSDASEVAQHAFVAYTAAEGRALYQTNCRPCHGTTGAGNGPTSAGFSLAPANFRDRNGIAALSPGEVLWRIEEGGPGLPREATPWDSSMPAWKHELDRELVWKIILGEYSTANVKPRTGPTSGHRHTQPVPSPQSARAPEKSWLEWPVPAKPAGEKTSDPAFVTRGRYIYYYRCMPCHGVTGQGDGPAANTMWPRPRDFTDIPVAGFEEDKAPPKFKFRTTKQGWLPLDEDLYRTISRGLTGTAMEGWDGVLEADEIWQVIAYLKTYSASWNDPNHEARNPNDPIVVKQYEGFDNSSPIIDYAALQPPPVTPALIEEGRETFLRIGCFQCHGFEARGDGPALGQHYDDWGYRMWPQNLANPLNYKAGHSIKDIYRTFANSLDGTVMPVASAKTLDAQDPAHGEHLQWALAAYVQSQVETATRREIKPKAGEVVAQKTRRDLPLDPLDAAWDRIAATVVPLSGQVIEQPRWSAPSVNQVEVKAAYDAGAIALWLRWDDRRPNITHADVPEDLEPVEQNSLGPKAYAFPGLRKKSPQQQIPVVFDARDQLELQWPAESLDKSSPPFFFYGDEKKPVVLWRWLADRQGLTVRKEAIEIAGSKADRLECTSDNSADSTSTGSVVTLRTARPPRAGHQPELLANTSVRSRAHWSNGAWTIVLSRSLTTDESDDVQFAKQNTTDARRAAHTPIPLAIHIWDGLAGETESRMAISSWIYLRFGEPIPTWYFVVATAVAVLVVLIAWTTIRRFRRAQSRQSH